MNENNLDDKYGTHDLYLAAYLMVIGLPYITTVRQGHRAIFYFDVTQEIGRAHV